MRSSSNIKKKQPNSEAVFEAAVIQGHEWMIFYSVLTIAGIKAFLGCFVVDFSVGFSSLLHKIYRFTPLEKDQKSCLVAL